MTEINKAKEAITAITQASQSGPVRRRRPGDLVEGVEGPGKGVANTDAETSVDSIVLSEDAQRALEDGR